LSVGQPRGPGWPSWYPDHGGVVGHVGQDHGPGSDGGVVADADAGKDDGPGPDQDAMAEVDPAAEAEARTLALTTIVVVQKANVFSFRALSQPVWSLTPWSNKWLLAAVTGTLLVQLAAVYSPFLQTILHTAALSEEDWLVIAIASAALLAMSELSKSILGARRPAAVKTV